MFLPQVLADIVHPDSSCKSFLVSCQAVARDQFSPVRVIKEATWVLKDLFRPKVSFQLLPSALASFSGFLKNVCSTICVRKFVILFVTSNPGPSRASTGPGRKSTMIDPVPASPGSHSRSRPSYLRRAIFGPSSWYLYGP